MINAEKLQTVGIDYQAGLKRFMNDKDLYEAVLNAFARENILVKVQQAYESHDYDNLLSVVHEAKGASGNSGFDELYNVSSALVAMLRTDEFSEQELTELYNNFVSVYTKIAEAVNAALGN